MDVNVHRVHQGVKALGDIFYRWYCRAKELG
jgi:hypothetical protein